MDTEPTNFVDVRIAHLEELVGSVDNRLSRVETHFDEGFAELRAELRAFRSRTDGTFDTLDRKITSHSNRIMLIWGLIFVSQVLMLLGIFGR